MNHETRKVSSPLRQTLTILAFLLVSLAAKTDAKCEFEAIFNFGDSNSDTGGFWAAFPSERPPYGMTYFKRPAGRATDGRLIIDFLVCDKLPQPDIFGKSLYTFYIGQNDFTGNIASFDSVKKYLPDVISQIASTIKEIYSLGGRTFFVLNLAPVGCYPSLLVEVPHNTSDIDSFGCLISYNNAAVDYNNMLKEAVRKTRDDIHDAEVIYVDTHSIMLELFQHPTYHGLKHGTKACCGYGDSAHNFNPNVFCGSTKMIDGKNMTASACNDPYNYVSWDGIHATEAANKIVSDGILGGSYFDPPFDLHRLCDIQPIG